MSARLRAHIDPDRVRVYVVARSLLGRETPVPRADWDRAIKNRRVIRAFEALVEEGSATWSEHAIALPSAVAAALDSELAEHIGLPPLAPLGLAVALDGRIEAPDGRLRLRWTDRAGREVRPERTGILLRWGEQSGRLSAPLLRTVDAADDYNQTVGRCLDERVSGWMPVQAALRAATGADVRCDGFLETFTIYQAGSFALDVHERADGVDFTPILMSRDKAISLEDEAPAEDDGCDLKRSSSEGGDRSDVCDGLADALLSPDEHRKFREQAVERPGPTRDAYVVGKNRYVLIDSSLRCALDVVKAKRNAPPEERRAFLRNPRAALAEALQSDGADVPTVALFIETKNYSDRVEGLGLWQRPHLPWLTRRPNAWLPECGWISDGMPVDPMPLTEDELKQIERDIEAAEVRGDPHVTIRGIPIPIDQAPSVLEGERRRTQAAGKDTGPDAEKDKADSVERLVLLIKKTNFEGVDYALSLKSREALTPPEPPADRMGRTPLKQHQVEGFRWLVDAWRSGWPGVLLADDMGLGKTFQALAFLAWIKSNALAARARGVGGVSGGPLLVVAPTALLKNWEKECADRLSSVGLGQRVSAYGHALRKLKLEPSRRHDPEETLDVAQLREADWILTTYETLTDHERVFARIPYAVVVFDEMQKVKAPDTLNTKAAKTLNADFVLGLTGTPIENRMEDLWCLFDRIVPGYLGDLKTFSRTYREDAAEKLGDLKRRLDAPVDTELPLVKAPPVMKRRMKADILDGLPSKHEKKYLTPMPDEQAQAYRELITEAHRRGERSRGFMLNVLHGMRGISLHPRDPAEVAASNPSHFEAFARGSARLSTTVRLLREIAERGEKALVFVENIAMQHVVAEGVAAILDLRRKPSVINGSTPGERRLAIVESFERCGDGFDVLILSPKAAGVGLNIVAANHVIHLSRWWNPAVEDQCNDRVYRIGQTKPVTIHLPIAVHPEFPNQSFDEALDRLLETKRQLSRHMLAPPTGEDDIETLFEGAVGQDQRVKA